MYEQASERWSPVQSVEKVLLSVISMLAGTLCCGLFLPFPLFFRRKRASERLHTSFTNQSPPSPTTLGRTEPREWREH